MLFRFSYHFIGLHCVPKTSTWSIWIIMLKNDFFDFPKLKWLHLTNKMDIFVRYAFYFFQDLAYQKLLKSANFWQRYSENKKMDVFGTEGIVTSCPQCTHVIIICHRYSAVWMSTVHWLSSASFIHYFQFHFTCKNSRAIHCECVSFFCSFKIFSFFCFPPFSIFLL